MARKDSLRIRKVETIAAAGLYAVECKLVEAGSLWCLELTAWEINKATVGGNTRCRLYIKGHGYNHYQSEQDAPAADTLYTWSKPIYIHQGERLVLEVDQAQAATITQIFLTGYRERLQNA